MTSAPARAHCELQMLEAMVDCAHELALGFGEAARGEPDLARRLQLDVAFHRGFLAVRMGIRLSLTLRSAQPPRPSPVERDTQPADDREAPERERLDTPPDRGDRDPADREREREYEPVSLPKFLASLRGLTADADRFPTKAGLATLPRLNDLLARAEAPAAPPPGRVSHPTGGVALLVRPPPDARRRLLGSASGPMPLAGAGRARPPPSPSG